MEKKEEKKKTEAKSTKEAETKKHKKKEKGESLEKQLKQTQEKLQEINDKYLRLYADFDNYQKRVAKEIEDVKEATKRSLINEFLVILDNMEKAILISKEHKDSIIEGIELTMKSFKDLLKKHGVEEIDPQKEQFNPDLHDALMMQPSDDMPKDTVLQTLQKGYMYKNKLIRPAKVIVSSGNNLNNENTNNKKEEQ